MDGTAGYALPIPTDARLVVIREKEVRLNGVMLEPIKNAAEMNPTKAGTPSHYAQRSHDALILYPSPLGIGTPDDDRVRRAGPKTHRYRAARHSR